MIIGDVTVGTRKDTGKGIENYITRYVLCESALFSPEETGNQNKYFRNYISHAEPLNKTINLLKSEDAHIN